MIRRHLILPASSNFQFAILRGLFHQNLTQNDAAYLIDFLKPSNPFLQKLLSLQSDGSAVYNISPDYLPVCISIFASACLSYSLCLLSFLSRCRVESYNLENMLSWHHFTKRVFSQSLDLRELLPLLLLLVCFRQCPRQQQQMRIQQDHLCESCLVCPLDDLLLYYPYSTDTLILHSI